MAGLQAGLDTPWVRALLGDFEENHVTLAYLTEKGFKAKTAADYA
jgi:hypothetical protein